MRRTTLAFASFMSLCSMHVLAAEPSPHPFGIRDLVAFERLGEPAVSLDGKQVVYGVSRLDLAANRRRSDLWLVPVAGGEPRRLTSHEASDSSARSLYKL